MEDFLKKMVFVIIDKMKSTATRLLLPKERADMENPCYYRK